MGWTSEWMKSRTREAGARQDTCLVSSDLSLLQNSISWMPKERGGGKPAICLPFFLHMVITNRSEHLFQVKYTSLLKNEIYFPLKP